MRAWTAMVAMLLIGCAFVDPPGSFSIDDGFDGGDGVDAGEGQVDSGVDAGVDSGVPPDGGQVDAGCVAETDEAFCERLQKDCELFTAADNCGQLRSASCGECEGVCTDNVCCVDPDPCAGVCDAQVVDSCGRTVACACKAPERCGGGGTPGICAAHPPLTGLEGYILDTGDGRFRTVRAVDGIPLSEGSCCFSTVEEARAMHEPKNMAHLPGQTTLVEGVIPALTGVDGYLRPDGTDRYRLDYAEDGALTGSAYCCSTGSIQEVRSGWSTRNLVFLPEP